VQAFTTLFKRFDYRAIGTEGLKQIYFRAATDFEDGFSDFLAGYGLDVRFYSKNLFK